MQCGTIKSRCSRRGQYLQWIRQPAKVANLDDEADDKKGKDEEGATGKGVSQFDLILGRLGACANREAADVLAGAYRT